MRRTGHFLVALAFGLGCPEPMTAGEVHDAVQAGDLEAVHGLLAADPDLRLATDDSVRTPLHWAVFEPDLDLTHMQRRSVATSSW